jgi:hypothetical protein
MIIKLPIAKKDSISLKRWNLFGDFSFGELRAEIIGAKGS